MLTLIELKNQVQFAKTQQLSAKTADFLKLFIEKVLKNKNEVTFEERLQLENTILDLKDQKILDQWRKFVESKTDKEAQGNATDLLGILADKIRGR